MTRSDFDRLREDFVASERDDILDRSAVQSPRVVNVAHRLSAEHQIATLSDEAVTRPGSTLLGA